eukprot:EG_transcript_33201
MSDDNLHEVLFGDDSDGDGGYEAPPAAQALPSSRPPPRLALSPQRKDEGRLNGEQLLNVCAPEGGPWRELVDGSPTRATAVDVSIEEVRNDLCCIRTILCAGWLLPPVWCGALVFLRNRDRTVRITALVCLALIVIAVIIVVILYSNGVLG